MKTIAPFFIILISVHLLGCGTNPEKQAQELLEKSIRAHGGAEQWKSISSIKFQKWTRLQHEDGSIESELNQSHEFRFQPYFEGKITWTKDSIVHTSSWDGTKMTYLMGDNEVKNADFLAAKKKDFDAAFYAVAQPWKLLDEGTKLTYEGEKTLENGRQAEVIRVDYGPDSDIWWYYFDPLTHLVIGNEIQLKDHRSLVYTESFEEVGGFQLHGRRESWRVNEKGERLFLRASYAYSDYQITP